VKVKNLDVSLNAVFATLQAYLGASYVNDFNKFGRTFQVRVQALPSFRMDPRDIQRLEVRNRAGEMVPIGAVARVERTFGPQIIQRFNLYPVATLQGAPAPGRSSGEALATMERIAGEKLPGTMGFDWSDMSYQEKSRWGVGLCFCLCSIAGLPRARRSIRKLDHSLRGNLGDSVRPFGRHWRVLV
jgi:HAE1 family hydrophobic/amphiphilic exporter-1